MLTSRMGISSQRARCHGRMVSNTPPCTDRALKGHTGTPPFASSAREGKVKHTRDACLHVLPDSAWLTKSTQCWLTK